MASSSPWPNGRVQGILNTTDAFSSVNKQQLARCKIPALSRNVNTAPIVNCSIVRCITMSECQPNSHTHVRCVRLKGSLSRRSIDALHALPYIHIPKAGTHTVEMCCMHYCVIRLHTGTCYHRTHIRPAECRAECGEASNYLTPTQDMRETQRPAVPKRRRVRGQVAFYYTTIVEQIDTSLPTSTVRPLSLSTKKPRQGPSEQAKANPYSCSIRGSITAHGPRDRVTAPKKTRYTGEPPGPKEPIDCGGACVAVADSQGVAEKCGEWHYIAGSSASKGE